MDEDLMNDEQQIFEYRDNDMLYYLCLKFGNKKFDDTVLETRDLGDGQRRLAWIPFIGFPVENYEVVSEQDGAVTQLSGKIDPPGLPQMLEFETEAEGNLGVRYYPISGDEPTTLILNAEGELEELQ